MFLPAEKVSTSVLANIFANVFASRKVSISVLANIFANVFSSGKCFYQCTWSAFLFMFLQVEEVWTSVIPRWFTRSCYYTDIESFPYPTKTA